MVVSSDGLQLHAERHGDEADPCIVFSCAFATTHENWRGQVAPLIGAGWQVVLWDHRGHGRSEVPADLAAYSMDLVTRDLGVVCDWASPDRPVVLAGLSFGGLASLHWALREPGRVRALVLAGSGPGFKNPKAAEGWAKQTERTARYLEQRGLEAFIAGKAGATSIGRRPELPAARAAARGIVAQDPAALAAFGRRVTGLAPSVIDELSQIGVPALVIVGSEDEAFLRAAEVMAAKMPAAVHAVLEGAGHILNIERAEEFDAALLGFLTSLPPLADR
ncbi:MAG: alpha/beta hydrolase [Myxococcota bacterium]|nr:alpha/beta hydrolase [Myxococcota bacterium]